MSMRRRIFAGAALVWVVASAAGCCYPCHEFRRERREEYREDRREERREDRREERRGGYREHAAVPIAP